MIVRNGLASQGQVQQMKMLRQLVCFAAALLCAGCLSMGRLEGQIKAPGQDESIFVLGVAPANFRVMIDPGSVKDGVFDRSNWYSAPFYGGAQGGYVVGKTHAGFTLAITMVRVAKDETSIMGEDFRPCRDARTVVFKSPPGKVVYLGSLLYALNGEDFRVHYWNDLDGARRYLTGAYPELADRVEQGSYELLPTSLSCTTTIYVPVYAPR